MDNPVVLRMLAHAGAIAVVITCNPVERLLTQCHYKKCPCKDSWHEMLNVAMLMRNASPLPGMMRDARVRCKEGYGNLDLRAMLPRIDGLRRSALRTVILHRDGARSTFDATIRHVATELGVQAPFPSSDLVSTVHHANNRSRHSRWRALRKPKWLRAIPRTSFDRALYRLLS